MGDLRANASFSGIVLQVCNCLARTRSQWCYFTGFIHSGKPWRTINDFKYGSTSPVALRKALLQYGFQGNEHQADSCLFGNEIDRGSQVQIFYWFLDKQVFLVSVWAHKCEECCNESIRVVKKQHIDPFWRFYLLGLLCCSLLHSQMSNSVSRYWLQHINYAGWCTGKSPRWPCKKLNDGICNRAK